MAKKVPQLFRGSKLLSKLPARPSDLPRFSLPKIATAAGFFCGFSGSSLRSIVSPTRSSTTDRASGLGSRQRWSVLARVGMILCAMANPVSEVSLRRRSTPYDFTVRSTLFTSVLRGNVGRQPRHTSPMVSGSPRRAEAVGTGQARPETRGTENPLPASV